MNEKALFEPVRIGLMPPMTGIAGIYGPEIVWAARIACDEINERGGVLGCPLELIIEDDGSVPQTAVPAARKLINEHQCIALIGNLLSSSRLSVLKQVAEPKRIPLLNFSFYEGSLFSRYFFHFAALPDQQLGKMIPYMAQQFGPKMFFAGSNYEWPRGSVDAAKRSLKKVDGDIVGEAYLDIGVKQTDIDNLLMQVARSGADVFVPYFVGLDQIMLLTRFTELGLKDRMAVVMGHYDEMMVSKLSAEVREGFYSSNTYFMSVDTPENRHYLERLAQQPGVEGVWPNGKGILTNFGEGTYQCVHAFARALDAAGTVEVEALVNALGTIALTSPRGKVQMQAKMHHATVNNYLSRCNADGSFTIVKCSKSIPPLIPERYRPHARIDLRQVLPKWVITKGHVINDAAQKILSFVDVILLVTNEEGIIVEANRSAYLLFGYTNEELTGMSIHLLVPPDFRERHVEAIRQFVLSQETERRMSQRDAVMGYRKDGTFVELEAGIAKFYNGNEWLLVVTMLDITERRRGEQKLIRQSNHDALTALPNRTLIHERLSSALQCSLRNKMGVALLFIDLDGFKLINDTHGHEAGDTLLKTVSTRLLEQVRPGDTVGRFAGDEFIVLCEQVEEPSLISNLAMRINEALREPIEFNDLPLFITASIGIAVGHGTWFSADELLRSADTAMYAVKQGGRDGWQFFNDRLQAQANQKMAIIQGLRLAISRHELSTCFQPIVTAKGGDIVGAELLLRWHTAEGAISPEIFIPMAEKIGVIVPIGSWVFREGCKAEVNWRHNWGEMAPYVSVNVSSRQLSERQLATDFANILRETGADPARILLEITETALMVEEETHQQILRRLTDLGLQIAVDGFGAGYSSLAQLTRLSISGLKIDKSLVGGLESRQENHALIRSIIGLGHSLGFALVAAGVENESQLSALQEYGCDFVQGYFFYRPMDEQAFINEMNHVIEARRL
ncbi:MAG: EAL domain-containing protein [Nitrosomonas sp.]|nr:EAL domain-containing protein [Nitrosomonas sp.]MDP1951439.1 EAL domain-containing protein [Nitrosomonas sp.]